MNKSKIISIILGILLIGGGTFVGTKAWLKDQKSINNDLVITTGTFKLDVKIPDKWEIISTDGTEITNTEDNNGFNNVRPGDKFKKTITLKNEGSLIQHLTVSQPTNLSYNPYFKIVEVKYNNIEDIHNKELKSKESKTFDIAVSTKPEQMENGKHEEIEIDLSKIISPIIIDSKQVNEK